MSEGTGDLTTKDILRTWWPLAMSWLLMAVELPAISAVVARLPAPEANLAAYGGVVFPVALIIESPVIMLLAASTALSRDRESFLRLRRYMMWAGGALTLLHVLLAFTPLYDLVVVGLLRPPAEIVELARLGLRIMTPWTWAIAYRRFYQGVLIRFGRSRDVGLGTTVRLSADALALTVGYLVGAWPGVAVASSAAALGVVSEAAFSRWRVDPVLRRDLARAEAGEALTLPRFLDFYLPLAMTSLLLLLLQPLGSAALSRMPRALESLAVWPVISGLVFMLRSLGVAYNEVVVALLDRPRAYAPLRRFTGLLAALTTALLLLVAATPLSRFYFAGLSGLAPALADLARPALWLALPVPGLTALHSWFQGQLVNRRRTRGVTEAVALFLAAAAAVLWTGVLWGRVTGLYVAWVAFSLGAVVQAGWLWRRARQVAAPLPAEAVAAVPGAD